MSNDLQTKRFLLDTFVPGQPAPQGSKRHVGRGIMVESSKAVAPWRTTVAWQVSQDYDGDVLDGPLHVGIEFIMRRPASAPKRSTPPAIKRPDLDKLTRAVLDALSGVVWRDDSVITVLTVSKRLAELGERAGAHIVAAEAS
jgi:crossover junction endodeoxyribonuclease RusA